MSPDPEIDSTDHQSELIDRLDHQSELIDRLDHQSELIDELDHQIYQIPLHGHSSTSQTPFGSTSQTPSSVTSEIPSSSTSTSQTPSSSTGQTPSSSTGQTPSAQTVVLYALGDGNLGLFTDNYIYTKYHSTDRLISWKCIRDCEATFTTSYDFCSVLHLSQPHSHRSEWLGTLKLLSLENVDPSIVGKQNALTKFCEEEVLYKDKTDTDTQEQNIEINATNPESFFDWLDKTQTETETMMKAVSVSEKPATAGSVTEKIIKVTKATVDDLYVTKAIVNDLSVAKTAVKSSVIPVKKRRIYGRRKLTAMSTTKQNLKFLEIAYQKCK